MAKPNLVPLLVIAISGAFAATPAPYERDALRRIVQEQCVPGLQQHASPAPCEEVILPDPNATVDGYAILHDRKGGAHFLLIPTRTLTGIESPALLDPATPDYVAAAWQHRDILDRWLHRTLPRHAVGLAINPRTARGQDQLHIHIACVSPMLDLVLSKNVEVTASEWSPVTIADRPYLARRIMGAEVLEANAVRLLRTEWADSSRDPGNDTIIIVGRTFASGPGVIVLVGTGWPGGETLLDSTCAVSS